MFLISAYSTIPSNNCIFGCPPDFSQNTVSVFCKKSRDIQKDLSETWLSRKAWPCTNKASIWIFKYEKHIVSSIFSLTGQGYGSSRLFHSFQAMAIKHLGEQTGADTYHLQVEAFFTCMVQASLRPTAGAPDAQCETVLKRLFWPCCMPV